eukprot:530097-Amphidinium_carterae.1
MANGCGMSLRPMSLCVLVDGKFVVIKAITYMELQTVCSSQMKKKSKRERRTAATEPARNNDECWPITAAQEQGQGSSDRGPSGSQGPLGS